MLTEIKSYLSKQEVGKLNITSKHSYLPIVDNAVQRICLDASVHFRKWYPTLKAGLLHDLDMESVQHLVFVSYEISLLFTSHFNLEQQKETKKC